MRHPRPAARCGRFLGGGVLLLHRGEIDSLSGKVREKGLTLVPTRMYFKDGSVKVEIALARGRERADKRRVVATRDAQRDMERALKRRR